MATPSDPSSAITTNVFRCHYSDLSKAIGPLPDILLSVSNRFYQHSFIDLQMKANINRSGGEAGASMLLDHVMVKIEQSDHYLPLVMDILREEVALTDIVHKMEEFAANQDSTITSSPGTGLLHEQIPSPDTTVADTISAAERLKSTFDSLCLTLLMVISQASAKVNLAWLKIRICLRLQYTRDNTPPEVQGHLTTLEQCPNAESVIMFLINKNFLGYLNFDLMEAFKPVLSSDKFDKKLEEYQLAHKQFIMNNFHNIVEAFQLNEDLRPASIVGLPKIKVELANPWKSKTQYYWKELVNDIVDWCPYIVITRVEFKCISITYQVLPFIIPRVVKDLTNETIIRRFTARGATFTIPDELVQDGIADTQWIMDTARKQMLLKKTTRNNKEGKDPVINVSFQTTDQPLEEFRPKLPLKPSRPVNVTDGYGDEFFLSPPPRDLQCPVCYLTVREPYQLSCCGATLCLVCSDSTSASVQCPCCRDTNHQIMADKSARRKVMSLKVKCTVPDCHWSGELLDLEAHHRMNGKGKCPQLKTSYDCAVPVWCQQELSSLHYGILPVYRTINDFNKHKRNNAKLRSDPFYTSDGGYRARLTIYPNGYGSGKGTHVSAYINLMKGPNDDNLEFPITGIFTAQILNWKGNNPHYESRGTVFRRFSTGMLNWKRSNHHIEGSIEFDDSIPTECRERVTTGEGAVGQGIGRFLAHDDLTSYLHHDMMCFKICYYPIVQPGSCCSPVPSWCDVMCSTSATPPCTRTLYSYSVYKKTSSEWYSQPFYSSDEGYKLQLRVDANGSGSGKGTHMSLYVYLMKGEYDETLSWPFNATITVQLLNWPSVNHHRDKTIPHHTAPIEHRQRVVEGTRAPGGHGYGQFITHTSLESPSDPTVRFINDDTICFRIINVDVINKP